MNLEELSQITELKLLGMGQALPHILQSISKTKQSILIVGPWLDSYFTGKIINSLTAPEIKLRFIVRIDGDDPIDVKTLSALNLAREKIKNFQARTLPNLHSKVILIDQEIFYMGSTNWYWYSLHESLEVTLTGETSIIPDIITQMNSYWDKATPLTLDDLKDYHDLEPIMKDINGWFLSKDR
ncbi:MAG: phospholipase D-like domain-containing protein [Methanobacterium formicicum]